MTTIHTATGNAPTPNAPLFAAPAPFGTFFHAPCEDIVACLAGPARAPAGARGPFELRARGGMLAGFASIPVTSATLARATRRLYADMLAATAGLRLYRIWNYVPRINHWAGGRENYREFCRGRAAAFERAHRADASAHMPAASAVGCDAGSLCVVFVAGRAAPRHHENPAQIPAYLYPPEHGPRPPSFARATAVRENRRDLVFISGTAAIKGHATQHAGDLAGQIACTLDNLRLIAAACGAQPQFEPPARARTGADASANARGNAGASAGGNAGAWRRHITIYLRHAADFSRAQALLAPALLRPDDRVTWLRSDICRAGLDIEIEATLIRAAKRGAAPAKRAAAQQSPRLAPRATSATLAGK